MFRKLLLGGLLTVAMASCQSQVSEDATTDTDTPETEANMDEAQELKGEHFGEVISTDGAMAYEEVITKMNDSDSLAVKVHATVESVCQMKGCWMEIVSEDEGMPNMRVRFKDYGFFVPKDIAGRQVIIEGFAFQEVTSVEDLRHYAEDEGLSEEEIENITEPREDYKFLASGVILLDDAAEGIE